MSRLGEGWRLLDAYQAEIESACGKNAHYVKNIIPFIKEHNDFVMYFSEQYEFVWGKNASYKSVSATSKIDDVERWSSNAVRCAILCKSDEQAAYYLSFLKPNIEALMSEFKIKKNNPNDVSLFISIISVSRMIALSHNLHEEVEYLNSALGRIKNGVKGNSTLVRLVNEAKLNTKNELPLDCFQIVYSDSANSYQVSPFDGSLVDEQEKISPPANWRQIVPWKEGLPKK